MTLTICYVSSYKVEDIEFTGDIELQDYIIYRGDRSAPFTTRFLKHAEDDMVEIRARIHPVETLHPEDFEDETLPQERYEEIVEQDRQERGDSDE